MAGEMLLGKRGHKSPVNSIATLVKAQNANGFWRSIGWISLLVPFVGLSYYAVVAAWAIDYLLLAATNSFVGFDGAASGTAGQDRGGRRGRDDLQLVARRSVVRGRRGGRRCENGACRRNSD